MKIYASTYAKTIKSVQNMNMNISRLHAIANRPERTVIGLMSGTSLDGLDVALCRFSGTGMDTRISLLEFETVPYGEEIGRAHV